MSMRLSLTTFGRAWGFTTVPPMPVIPVDLSVKEVLLQGREVPTVESGDQLEATFLSSSLVPGKERAFFLRWTDLHLSTGSVNI